MKCTLGSTIPVGVGGHRLAPRARLSAVRRRRPDRVEGSLGAGIGASTTASRCAAASAEDWHRHPLAKAGTFGPAGSPF